MCIIRPSFHEDAWNLKSVPLGYSSSHFTPLTISLVPEGSCLNGLPVLGAGLPQSNNVTEAIAFHGWPHARVPSLVAVPRLETLYSPYTLRYSQSS